MDIKPTLRIVKKAKVKKLPGIVKGQVLQPLVGVAEFPSEKIRAAVATFRPGVHELLHWHPIEVFYYVIGGSAIVRDYHGKNTRSRQARRSTRRRVSPDRTNGRWGRTVCSYCRCARRATDIAACNSPWTARPGARTSSSKSSR